MEERQRNQSRTLIKSDASFQASPSLSSSSVWSWYNDNRTGELQPKSSYISSDKEPWVAVLVGDICKVDAESWDEFCCMSLEIRENMQGRTLYQNSVTSLSGRYRTTQGLYSGKRLCWLDGPSALCLINLFQATSRHCCLWHSLFFLFLSSATLSCNKCVCLSTNQLLWGYLSPSIIFLWKN